MSWIFGLNKEQQLPQAQTFQEAIGAAGGSDGGGKKDGGDDKKDKSGGGYSNWSNFDPTGLERAATAAKELDRSGHLFGHCLFGVFCFFVPNLS